MKNLRQILKKGIAFPMELRYLRKRVSYQPLLTFRCINVKKSNWRIVNKFYRCTFFLEG